MREDFHAVAYQLRAVPADLFAMLHVFASKFLGGGERERFFFFNGFWPRAISRRTSFIAFTGSTAVGRAFCKT